MLAELSAIGNALSGVSKLKEVGVEVKGFLAKWKQRKKASKIALVDHHFTVTCVSATQGTPLTARLHRPTAQISLRFQFSNATDEEIELLAVRCELRVPGRMRLVRVATLDLGYQGPVGAGVKRTEDFVFDLTEAQVRQLAPMETVKHQDTRSDMQLNIRRVLRSTVGVLSDPLDHESPIALACHVRDD